MGIIANLVPREGKFFEYFNQHADRIAEASRELMVLLSEYSDEPARAARVERINDLEHEADRITHDTATLLQTIFVTPLDRDDIHRLISRMDDVLDLMQDAAESLSLYDVHQVTAHAVELASLLQNGCERLQAAVALLNSMKNAPVILRLCREIDTMESRADRVMRTAISTLFRTESDTRQLIKLKAIYELLETATDRCQDVADVIEGVVLQNA
jgi:predicted phosphate transport protein (TIGR00153 family)